VEGEGLLFVREFSSQLADKKQFSLFEGRDGGIAGYGGEVIQKLA